MNSSKNSLASQSGLSLVFIATAIAGGLGYIITVLLARMLGADYGQFAIFWSALYLVIGSLAGLQQEIARATTLKPRQKNSSHVQLSFIATLISIGLALSIFVSSPIWQTQVFGNESGEYVLPFAVGAGLWVLVSFLTGVLYGSHQWRLVALTLFLDVAFRAMLVIIFPYLGLSKSALPWLVILPFGLLLLIIWQLSRKKLVNNLNIDVSLRQLLSNFSKTLLASLSMSIIVSGFPLILGGTTKLISATTLSAIIFAVILTRAPLVMVSMSLQSYFIIYFRDSAKPTFQLISKFVVLVVAVALVLGILALWLANPIIIFLVGSTFSLSPWFLALLTVSSASTALLALTGAAVLASSRHSVYSAGWLSAAIVTTSIMFLPLQVETKTILALSLGPAIGIAIHLAGLLISNNRPGISVL